MNSALFMLLLLQAPQETGLRVVSDFPGGSANVESVDATTRTIQLLPADHPGRGWRCWWSFKVEGLRAGETLTLDVGGGIWATPDRAAVSLNGTEWTQTAPGTRPVKGRIVYTYEAKGPEAWFAWGPPYVLANAVEATARAARAGPHVRAFELCRSREGRPVPALRVTETDRPDRLGIWVQARQHAWESGGSWVGQGFIDWIVSDDPGAAALRKRAEIVIVPIMDVDNVERGAGGKEGKPHDHNRDWSDDPHWPEVRAAQDEIRRWTAEGRFDLFVDLHNPGADSRGVHFHTVPREILGAPARKNLDAFLAAATAELGDPLPFKGRLVESGAKYDKNWEKISNSWMMRSAGGHIVSVTLETGWNTPHSNPDGYRGVGKNLGATIARYFSEDRRK